MTRKSSYLQALGSRYQNSLTTHRNNIKSLQLNSSPLPKVVSLLSLFQLWPAPRPEAGESSLTLSSLHPPHLICHQVLPVFASLSLFLNNPSVSHCFSCTVLRLSSLPVSWPWPTEMIQPEGEKERKMNGASETCWAIWKSLILCHWTPERRREIKA